MLTNEPILIMILFVNLVIAIGNLIIRLILKDYARAFITTLIMIVAPVVGGTYIFSSWLFFTLFFKDKDYDINISELSMSKDRIKVILKPDADEALNIVPFEEAFLVSDHKSVRRLLLDALKQDRYSSMQQILQAVSHSDSEVAHYAASAISEIVDEFFSDEKELRANMYDTGQVEAIISYLDYVYSYLSKYILPKDEQRHFIVLFEEGIDFLKSKSSDSVDGALLLKVVELHIAQGNMEIAQKWVQQALDTRDEDLESYKAGLKYHYTNRDKTSFLGLLEQLKSSDLIMDYETVELVRFFS